MQVCESCGREVKYIAGGYDKTFVCEPKEKVVVSEGGWLHKAYALHECGSRGDYPEIDMEDRKFVKGTPVRN